MTVSSDTYAVEGAGNGSATAFPFTNMVIYDVDDIEVIHVDADGVETTLTRGTGPSAYSVALSSTTLPSTGTVTYPEDEVTPMPSGEKIVMRYGMTFTQLTSLGNQEGYFPKVQEQAFDEALLRDLEQQEEIDRSMRKSADSTSWAGEDLELKSLGTPTTAGSAATKAYVDSAVSNGGVTFFGDESELTISSGVITVTASYHRVDTEGDASSDDLDTINGATNNGQLLILRAANSGRTVIVKDGTGNLALNSNMSLDNVQDSITLLYDTSDDTWYELSRVNAGA